MNIEEIRLTEEEIMQAGYGGATITRMTPTRNEQKIANTATDKAIRELTNDVWKEWQAMLTRRNTGLDLYNCFMQFSMYIEALKELVRR